MATTRTSGPRTAFLLKFLPTVVIITCLLSLRPLLHIVRDRRSPGRNLSAATMLPPSSPTLGPQLPSFSGAELQIVVLTMIRPESLKRLLISLENVDYLGDAVNLEIWVDRPRQIQASSTSTKILWESAVNISQQFPWSHGTKQVNIRNTTAGLRKQWLDAWKPTSSTQRALILEDDIEVSQYFWRWLKAVHNRYADSEDICGFTLQRAQLCARSIECGSRELHGGPVQDGHSFAMPLVGSWGFSPTARHWSKFRAWAANFSGKPSVPGLKQDEWYRLFQKQGRCPGLNCMWTILHLKYTSIFKDSKTVYFKGPSGTALAISHREPGLHYARSGGADAALLQLWSDSFVRFPNRLPDVSLGGKLVSSYLSDSEEDLYKITLGGKLNSQASSDPDEAVVREAVAKWRSLNGSQNAPPVHSEIPVANPAFASWRSLDGSQNATRISESHLSQSQHQLHTQPAIFEANQSKAEIIAICCPTRSQPNWISLQDSLLHTTMIPSIKRTVSPAELSKYDFHLFLAANDDDVFWATHYRNLSQQAPFWLTVHFGFHSTLKHRIPFNQLMQDAFIAGSSYFVRINDDTEFVTEGWVSKAVAKLASYDPPNVGMVGPSGIGDRRPIMAHDMTHRTHLQIFETYYPPIFSAWYIDDWISRVYGPGRSTKMRDWLVMHHVKKHGTRYQVQFSEKAHLKTELKKGTKAIEVWLASSHPSHALKVIESS
uniref:Glycosyl transferase 64 domain-containing protein n=1 Tax=Hemiselmis andersenii TaxID=464988 RepID=A0A6T8KKK3_HEMAN|mmetsp:Transcript_40166/g.94042  ORF Transcript_40166/g.94042 Transcript_40166/m.94042 type:complete len:716 (+) Transcript_40166:219-2366(+)